MFHNGNPIRSQQLQMALQNKERIEREKQEAKSMETIFGKSLKL